MSSYSRALSSADAIVFMLLAVASIREYRRGHGAAGKWAAIAFVSLGAVASLGLAPAADASSPFYRELWGQLVIRILIAVIVGFPYCLYRLAATFRPPQRRGRRALDFGFVTVILVGFALPRFPAPGQPRPAWLIPYSAAIAIEWTGLSVLAAIWLWRSGAGRPSAARKRMRLLAAGTLAMNILILVSVLSPQRDAQHPNHVVQVLDLVVAGIFFIGLAPPQLLVDRWGQPEQRAARAATSELMSAVTAAEVATRVLPHVMAIVGAQSAALYDLRGKLWASHGSLDEDARDPGAADPDHGVLRFELKTGGALVVRSDSYSPLFGGDKIAILQGFAGLIDLALARCAGIAREREFISNAAHELRTPLTTVTGLAEMLATERDQMTPDQAEECMLAMSRQGKRARELVNNLLDMAQIERGGVRFADEVVVLSQVVGESLQSVPAPEGHHVDVDVPANFLVRADAARLQQVIVNLVTNAYRYGGPTVRIAAEPNGEAVVLSVSDDGSGIPSDLVPKLFDPFSRGQEATGTGSGLGLAICRRIVDGFGGSIAYAGSDHAGAQFNVHLRKAS
jgi:signal transduction histidine kinase